MAHTWPTVSVIIPTWNRRHTLRAAIESALLQTIAPLEVLVCDDGSTDDSRALVEGLSDARVRWIDGPHAGRPAVPRNRGLAHSRGEWLAFLDSDDAWLPDKLERQLAVARQLDCRASCTDALRVVPQHGVYDDMRLHAPERIRFRQLLRGNLVICSSAMFHGSLLAEVHGFPEASALTAIEDYALWLRVATLSDFAFVPSPCVRYTDDSTASIRGGDVRDTKAQHREVFADYLRWAPTFGWQAAQLRYCRARMALRELRHLRNRWQRV